MRTIAWMYIVAGALACTVEPAADGGSTGEAGSSGGAEGGTTVEVPTGSGPGSGGTTGDASTGEPGETGTGTTQGPDMGPAGPPAVDYLILAADPLRAAAEDLAELQTSRDYTVVLKGVGEVVEPGAEPEAAVLAIRDYIRGYWQIRDPGRPMHVLLVGDAVDGAPYDGTTIPTGSYTYSLSFEPGPITVASDHVYADMDDDELPDVAVGRLPVADAGAVQLYFMRSLTPDKVGPWDRRINLFAGGLGQGPLVDGLVESLVDRVLDEISHDFDITMTYALQGSPYVYIPELFSDQVYARINEGALLVSYIGHGSETSFDLFKWNNNYYPILDLGPLDNLDLAPRTPILSLVACAMGAFDLGTSVSETLLARIDGPLAVLSSTRNSYVYPNTLFARELGLSITEERAVSVGAAFMAGKRRMIEHEDPLRQQIDGAFKLGTSAADLEAMRRSHLHLYTLFGDPGRPIRYPLPASVTAAPDETTPGAELAVEVSTPLGGGKALVTLESDRSQILQPIAPVPPDGDPKRDAVIASNYAAANDKRVATREVPLVAGAVSTSVKVPDDVPAGFYWLRVYAEDGPQNAFGSTLVRVR